MTYQRRERGSGQFKMACDGGGGSRQVRHPNEQFLRCLYIYTGTHFGSSNLDADWFRIRVWNVCHLNVGDLLSRICVI